MPGQASVFEETYRYYLGQISRIDLPSKAACLGAATAGNDLVIKLMQTPYLVSPSGIMEQSGRRPNFAIRVVLARYVLQCPSSLPEDGNWVTYREFRDASPLVGYFTANTNRIIENTFVGNLAGLETACKRLGAVPCDLEADFDLAVRFTALARIPITLTFNDRDESFPAQSAVLFRQSAEAFLDMECLCILGTLLAGKLVAHVID